MQRLLSLVGPSQAEAAFQAYRSLFEFSPDGIFTIDTGGRFTSVNPAFGRIVGYEAADLIGVSFADLLFPEDVKASLARFAQALTGAPQTYDSRVKHRSGQTIHLSVTRVPIETDGSVTGALGIAKDVTREKEAAERLTWVAFHDPLTKLSNRTGVSERMQLLKTQSTEVKLAILFLDLDNFKEVNTSLGHQGGDELLKLVADRLRQSVPPGATPVRWGGDEFVVLLENPDHQDLPTQVAESIVHAMKEPFYIEGESISISFSMGIAVGSNRETTPSELVRNANTALHHAKRKGKHRYLVFNSIMSEFVRKRFHLVNDLRQALKRQEFVLFYQPLVSLPSGRLSGFEALVRWQHPERGLLLPADFIAAAEDSDLITHLDNWVLEQACEQLRVWQTKTGDRSLFINVNLSARQLQDPTLIAEVSRVLQQTGIDPRSLRLEITEGVMMQYDGDDGSGPTLEKLKALGVMVAIDDFGTGYSSLAYLKTLPVDILKIDRSFVKGLGTDSRDSAVVRAIMGIATALGLEVTAEGVETELQLQALRSLGCDRAQGRYLAPPMRAGEVEQVLRRSADGAPLGGSRLLATSPWYRQESEAGS